MAAPAYWPATAFGGPIPVLRRLAAGLSGRGHEVTVVTSALETVAGPRTIHTVTRDVDGVRVVYLATPVHYRWMGAVPTARWNLRRAARPDVVHVFGFRDPIGTAVARFARRRSIPYLLEALGMFRPKLRKLALKRTLDRTLFSSVPRHASLLVAASGVERREYLEAGLPPERISVRPNGFPEPTARPRGAFRARLGIADATPLALCVGRVARGKGLEVAAEATARLDGVHLAVVGPDDGHGMTRELERLRATLDLGARLHVVGALPPDGVAQAYADADLLVLASAHEN